METGLPIVGIGLLLVTSLLLRGAAAGYVTPEMVPPCLLRRLQVRDRNAPLLLALATCVVLVGLAVMAESRL